MSVVTIKELLEAGVHFGHQTRRWNPKMKPFIFEAKNKIYIIDLQQTAQAINKANNFIHNVCAKGRSVLFVGTKKQAKQAIKNAALGCEMFYVNERWLGGTLTNNATIKHSIRKLKELEELEKDGGFDNIPKKEASVLKKELARLRKHLDGIKNMENLPGVMFVVDPMKEKIAVMEANKLNIPVISIVDTNCNPDAIDIVIPGNDDAIKSITLISEKMALGAKTGTKEQVANEGAAAAAKAAAAKEKEAEKKAAAPVAKKAAAPAKKAPAAPAAKKAAADTGKSTKESEEK